MAPATLGLGWLMFVLLLLLLLGKQTMRGSSFNNALLRCARYQNSGSGQAQMKGSPSLDCYDYRRFPSRCHGHDGYPSPAASLRRIPFAKCMTTRARADVFSSYLTFRPREGSSAAYSAAVAALHFYRSTRLAWMDKRSSSNRSTNTYQSMLIFLFHCRSQNTKNFQTCCATLLFSAEFCVAMFVFGLVG